MIAGLYKTRAAIGLVPEVLVATQTLEARRLGQLMRIGNGGVGQVGLYGLMHHKLERVIGIEYVWKRWAASCQTLIKLEQMNLEVRAAGMGQGCKVQCMQGRLPRDLQGTSVYFHHDDFTKARVDWAHQDFFYLMVAVSHLTADFVSRMLCQHAKIGATLAATPAPAAIALAWTHSALSPVSYAGFACPCGAGARVMTLAYTQFEELLNDQNGFKPLTPAVVAVSWQKETQ
jgi:hypothetical protein